MANLTEIGNFGYRVDALLAQHIIGDWVDFPELPNRVGFKSHCGSYLFFLESFVNRFNGEAHEQYTVLPRNLEVVVKELDKYGDPISDKDTLMCYARMEEVSKKGFFGITTRHSQKRFLMTSDVLEQIAKDEPLWIAQWGIPRIVGFSGDARDGFFFGVTAYFGESQAPLVREAIMENPGILKETGKIVLPKIFEFLETKAWQKGLLNSFPNGVVDVTYEPVSFNKKLTGFFVPHYNIVKTQI